ncbi:hypothetical protein [Nocardia aurea]|uniref:Potassium channel domain-containing protein n=1 Tax=Nocardia aurea TaxID=2144174 RepID=A0ABV3FU32_9NOCA
MTDGVHRDEMTTDVRLMTYLIERDAAGHCERIELSARSQPGEAAPTERQLLAEFHHRVEKLVIDYEQSEVPPRGDELIFRDIYEEAGRHHEGPEPPGTDQPTPHGSTDRYAAVTKLLALETEFRGPRRLSGTQHTYLAEWYEKLGPALRAVDLHAHSALAYKRATWLHGVAEDFTAQDRCRLARARAKRRATRPAWRRIPGWISDVLCGYGFRPFLLLAWIAAQLVLFTGLLLAVESLTLGDSIQICLTNYLNPVGIGDLGSIGVGGRVLLLVEAWTGIVFTSVFFALLVRRWFRF